LRQRATTLGFAHRLRLDSHCRQGLNPYEIALVGRGHERKRRHQALADAQLIRPGTDSRRDEGAIRQRADGLLVNENRHLRGRRLPVSAKHEHQRLAGRRDGTPEILLGVCGLPQEKTTQGSEQESASQHAARTQRNHGRISILLLDTAALSSVFLCIFY
jgi:hypothetical protein